MSYSELFKWADYLSKEPYLSDRIEVQLATIATLISSFGGGKAKPTDFMVSKIEKEEKKTTQQDIKSFFGGLAKG